MNRRIGYPHIVSTLALVIALLGSGLAVATSVPKLAKNSVASKQIKNNSIKGKDIGSNAVTGATVDESSLGKVPNAAVADRATQTDSVQHAAKEIGLLQPQVAVVQHGPFTVWLACEHDAGTGDNYTALKISAVGVTGLALVRYNGTSSSVAFSSGAAPKQIMYTVETSFTGFDLSVVAEGQFMEVTGQLYYSNSRCGTNLVSLG